MGHPARELVELDTRRHPTDLPHDDEAERWVLGAMLLSIDAALEVLDTGLDARHFHRPRHRSAFQAIRRTLEAGDRPDRITLAACAAHDVDAAGGPGTFDQLLADATGTANATRWAERIIDLRHQWDALAALDTARRSILDGHPVDDVLAPLADLRTGTAAGTWAPLDLGPVLLGEPEDTTPTILRRTDGVGLVYPGRISALIGPPEASKSWCAQAATAETIKAGGAVAWIDLEDVPSTLVARLRALGLADDLIATRLAYLRPAEPATAATLAAIASTAHPALVVVDSVTELLSLQGLDGNSSAEVATMHRLLRTFTDAGAAVLLLDHVTKSTEERGRWAIGSERKLSGIDGAAIGFKVDRPFAPGATGRIRLSVAKDRPGALRAIATGDLRTDLGTLELVSWPDSGITWTITPPDPAGFRPTVLMARISDHLAQHGPQSTRAIRDGVQGKAAGIDLALRHLIDAGHITVDDSGRQKLHTLTTPFTAP